MSFAFSSNLSAKELCPSKYTAPALSTAEFLINSVFVRDESDYALRKQYQTKALASTYSLLSMMDISYRVFGIENSRMEHWTKIAVEVQTMLRNWRKSDIDRYKNMG